MVRKYKKKIGPGGRQNYNPVYLENAIREVKRGCSIRQASEHFAVPYTTIQNAITKRYKFKLGRQPCLSEEEERQLVDGMLVCANWGFPLQSTDVRNIVQMYLNNSGRVEKRFKDNRPGLEFIRGFMKRNEALTVRLSENVKRARADVTRATIETYFKNLAISLEGVPATNVVNYDETNFTDDPGQVRVIVKRGVKHAERIKDTSKTSISVMMAATADGNLLPPYTVYKAKHIYPTWIEGGIPGAGYNRNQSGWFDLTMFQDWFFTILLPYFKKLDGPKVMVGDNLSSHLSPLVIKQCQDNDIRFVLLPPNSTHLCQPLDVAFFRPMKIAWRQVLDKWKTTNRGVLPKAEFPKLLKEAIDKIGLKVEANIKAGFKKTGIFPLDSSKVLTQIPDKNTQDNHEPLWTKAFVTHLEQARFSTPSADSSKKNKRGKRMSVEPGKGVIIDNKQTDEIHGDISPEHGVILDDELLGDISPEHETDFDFEQGPSGINIEENTDGEEERQKPKKQTEELEEALQPQDFILTSFPTNKRERKFVGRIVDICGGRYVVNFLRKKTSSKEQYFYFPEIADIQEIEKSQIIQKIKPRDLRRGRFVFTQLNDAEVE